MIPTVHFQSSSGRYMAIPSEQGYSFHRFYLAITHLNLKPSVAGIGYKAGFYGDDLVKAQLHETEAFGYTLQLGNYSPKTAYKGREAFISGNRLTLRIDHFDVDRYGETPLYATAILKLTDGTVISTEPVVTSFRSLPETISLNHTAFTDQQLRAVKTIIEQFPIIKTWNTENLFK